MQKKIPDHAEKVFSGVLFELYQWQQEMFDGSFATFETLHRRTGCNIVAITQDQKILINHEEQPHLGVFVTLPGGNSETDDLLADAKRELLEETGYESDSWREWFTADILKYDKLDWNAVYFIARNCIRTSGLDLDSGEKIETSEVTFDEFVKISQRLDFRNRELQKIISQIKDDPVKLENFRKEIFGE